MITAEIMDYATSEVLYTMEIHAELYLALILGVLVAGLFFLMAKR